MNIMNWIPAPRSGSRTSFVGMTVWNYRQLIIRICIIHNFDAYVKSGNRRKKTAISTHQQGQRELLSTFGGGINFRHFEL